MGVGRKQSYEAYTTSSTFKPSSTKMVTVVASYNITPNQATPKDPLWLSVIEQSGYLGHVPTLYIYKAKHNCNIDH
ncbi:hypothetical protein JHK85_023610 [Glycine max]|nr:hypothetical protein JHK85_023610 [Glycine max]